MPIDVSWDNPDHTIMRFAFVNPWTWDILRVANQQAFELAERVPHRYVSVMDFQAARIVPSGSFFARGKEVTAVKPTNAHPTIIVVGASSVFQSLANTFVKLYGRRMGMDAIFLSTLAEARRKAADLLSDT